MRPNIIIILADDLGAGDLSMNGSVIRTPNIDKLAGEGVYLTDFYASANVCTPSRAGLLTGRYAIRMGLASRVLDSQSTYGLPAGEYTLGELLQDNGYRTALVGKWHLGHQQQYWPTEHGFDEFYGLPYSNDMVGLALYRNSKVIEQPVEQNSLTVRYTAQATGFIRRNREQPFFLYLSHTFPHIPLHASPAFRGRSKAGLYGDAVEELDWSVGELARALKEEGLDANTLVFFSSDNGAWFEGSNGQLRGMKGLTWDAAYRVPLIARWPGRIEAGSRSTGIAMNIDLLPTIATLTGITGAEQTKLDGRNIWPLLTGSQSSPHEALYLFHNEDITAVRTQDWKYLAWAFYRTRLIAFRNIKPKMGFDYELLFDMRVNDPEHYSQASNEPRVLKRMHSLLADGRRKFEHYRTMASPEVYP